MLAELEYSDWSEVFKYADKPRRILPDRTSDGHFTGAYGDPLRPPGHVDAPFTREDVVEVVAMEDGENDGASWIGVFKLADGRYAFIEAGCDYTGWGCQESGDSYVSNSLNDLVRWGLSNEDRDRLGLPLVPVPPPSREEMAEAAAGLRRTERTLTDLS